MLPPLMVLVFEDEPLIAMELEAQLQELGFATTAPKSIGSARLVIERVPLHFALLHYGSGVAVTYLAPILAAKQVRFAICSADDQGTKVAQAMGGPFIPKPFLPSDISAVVPPGPAMMETTGQGDLPWGAAP